MIERSRVRLPAGALPGNLGQLSLPSLWSIRAPVYWPGLRLGAFTCVGWQVTLIRQVTPRSSMSFPIKIELYAPFTFHISDVNLQMCSKLLKTYSQFQRGNGEGARAMPPLKLRACTYPNPSNSHANTDEFTWLDLLGVECMRPAWGPIFKRS